MRVSIDANVLFYAADLDAGERHERAAKVVERAGYADCVLTLQALGEFFHAVTRKRALSAEAARGFLSDWRAVFRVHAATPAVLDDALDAVRSHNLGFWDALLWATVQRAGCRLLLSEDFQDGRRLGQVTFVNPFEEANRALLDRALPPT